MKFHQTDHGSYYHTDCPNFLGHGGRDHLVIAITTDALYKRCERGQRAQLGQLHGIICTGAIFGVAAHRGLKRPMLVSDDTEAHLRKYVLVLNPDHDARMIGDRFFSEIEHIAAPQHHVFVLYLTTNAMNEQFPDVDLWIEHWTWIDCDLENPKQPFGYHERYDDPCIWEAQ